MTSYRLRAFRPADLDGILDAWRESAPEDAVSSRTFSERVLLDAGFDEDGLTVAEADGEVVGAIRAVAGSRNGAPVPSDGGWITFVLVRPSWRGRGIGSALLAHALDWLQGHRARWAAFAGYPPAYFLPGLDDDTYPDARHLMSAAGFVTQSRAVAMELPLTGYRAPDQADELRRRREAEGYGFGTAGYGDLPETIRFASERIAPDWGDAIRAAVVQSGEPDRVLICRDPSGSLAGFAVYGCYGGDIERFGPFGVDESKRGTGLGRILLHLTLERMRAEGATRAWFLWADEESPAGRLYRSTGFRVTRRFETLRRELDGPAE